MEIRKIVHRLLSIVYNLLSIVRNKRKERKNFFDCYFLGNKICVRKRKGIILADTI